MSVGQPSALRLLQRSTEIIVDSGTFSFEVSPGAFDVPQDLFVQPEPVAIANPDGLYLCAGATYQIIQCSYEVWSARPESLPVADGSEIAEVAVQFSEARLQLWGGDEVDPAIPLPHAGRYWAGVRVAGRQSSRDAYNAGLVRPVTGIESWLVRFWSVSPDDTDLEPVTD